MCQLIIYWKRFDVSLLTPNKKSISDFVCLVLSTPASLQRNALHMDESNFVCGFSFVFFQHGQTPLLYILVCHIYPNQTYRQLGRRQVCPDLYPRASHIRVCIRISFLRAPQTCQIVSLLKVFIHSLRQAVDAAALPHTRCWSNKMTEEQYQHTEYTDKNHAMRMSWPTAKKPLIRNWMKDMFCGRAAVCSSLSLLFRCRIVPLFLFARGVWCSVLSFLL